MKNTENWKPSKFIIKNGKLVASRDPRQVGISSRLVADIVADFYWTYLKDHCGGKLLDLGCGHVPFFEVYRDLVEENVCVDWASTVHKNEYLGYECDLTRDLPFPDEFFDTIILSDVLEHVAEPNKIWREMARTLRPGGKILLNVPFYYCLHERPHDYYRYTEFALRRFAELARLEVLVLKPIGGSPEILTDIIAKNLMGVRKIGKYGSMTIQFLCMKFIKTRMGKKISERTAEFFPFGYFMIVRKL